MDVIDYINTITTNGFTDWVKCHNNMLYNTVSSQDLVLSDDLDDLEIRIIGHILKVLYNEKISVTNKYYLLLSIEENLEYFIKNENGAIHLAQTLTTDLKNILHSKWDYRYTCQLLIVICSVSVYYDLFISSNHLCGSFVTGLLTILFNIISTDNITTNWTNLKLTALSSLSHLETMYPTILSQYEARLAELVQKERSIFFELFLPLYSLVFKNNILNKCRLQRPASVIGESSSETEMYNSSQIVSFMVWNQDRPVIEDKIVGNQTNILKSLRSILEQAMSYLSPLSINIVVDNCLSVTGCLSQQTTSLWVPFIGRFISSQNLNILQSLVSLKRVSRVTKEDILPGEQLQETLLSVLNNCRIVTAKRQVVAQWLFHYPLDDQVVHSVTMNSKSLDSYSCTFEPELIRHLYLRSIDILEIKYCKLMLLNRAIKTSKSSDCNSYLLYSSLKEIMKSLHYFDSDMPSNILLRVMFAMHIRHANSVLARDFESSLETIVVNYPNVLSAVMFYLNGLEKYLVTDEHSRNFSSKCLSQIAKLSSDKLVLLTDHTEFSSIRLHIQVLNYVIKFTDIDLTEYLVLLRELLTTCKLESNINWFDEAYDLVLNLCYNIIKKYGSSKFYQELASILNEIRNEYFENGADIKANFLYALIVSLPSKKMKTILTDKVLENITEKDFELIQGSLIESYLDEGLLDMQRPTSAITTSQAIHYQYDGLLDGYYDFLRSNVFPVVFDVQLQSKTNVTLDGYLYGVSVNFPTDSNSVEISPWHIPNIRSIDGNLILRRPLSITVKEPESFSICATFSATKLDGTFVIYSVDSDDIELMDLSLAIPIVFPSQDSRHHFVSNLITIRLLARSFVSINFGDQIRRQKFEDIFNKFIFLDEDETVMYLMFLAPNYHVALRAVQLADFCFRFDFYTDLKMIHLVTIERALKHFESYI